MVSAHDCLSALNNSIIQQNQVLSFASGEMKEILSIVIRTPGSKSTDLLYAPERNEKVCIQFAVFHAIKIVCLCVN